MVTFPVDDVAPTAERLPTRPLGELFPDALVVGGDPALDVVGHDGVHPLLSAVAQAFAQHRPLVLSPDAVWLTIAGGVAQHVRLHAERLRPRLVGHQGRRRLVMPVDGPMPDDAASWAFLVEGLSKQLDDVGLFECDFSTSTETDRIAGRIVLMDVHSPYFSYWLTCVCGIPSVTLSGTVEDWKRIRERVDALERFELQTWCRSLAPIADEFVRAAAGAPDVAFWRRVYNPVDAYGGEVITGWVTRFYPYLKGVSVDVPNPMLELPVGEPRDVTIAPGDVFGYTGPGIRSTSVPATVSRVIVNVNDRVARANRAVALHGGLVAVAQDPDGALRPVAGWYLAPAAVEIDDVIERIVREHETTPPAEDCDQGPADLLALYSRIGSATLFDGRWRLVPVAERRHCYHDGFSVDTLVELADGRTIAGATGSSGETHWIVCRVAEAEADPGSFAQDRIADDPADVPVLGTSLAMLLEAALDAGGDIAHLETGRLSDVQ
ncbi:DUF4419 domain-containing protein [Dactylosporangium sp. AC04546]|uniref:DUF4419 domain-containing protein n=1 Tax=Dactylosporangium sp. AC04546 TaxID=2862460 RepID=UPI001EDEADAA|nr:DUF4419 domain-containing protein [Dactylosporangium sp. AC04546]WVK79102.1 DUF4419 domain-containing protein [Dactylosporangium sp. AC04546]